MEAYDADTGQVYRETSVPVRSMKLLPLDKCTGRKEDPAAYWNRHGTGTSSLFSTAIRSCVWHINGMTAEHFEHVPWTTARMVYSRMKQTDTLDYEAWTVFREAYADEAEVAKDFTIRTTRAQSPLSLIPRLSVVLAKPFSHLTLLRIRDVYLPEYALMLLLDLHTLALLDLAQAYTVQTRGLDERNTISSRSLRNWGRAVREKQAFPKLKVLLLQKFLHVESDLEPSLRALLDFPALLMVHILEAYRPKIATPVWASVPSQGCFHPLASRNPPRSDILSTIHDAFPHVVLKRAVENPLLTTAEKLSHLYTYAITLFRENPVQTQLETTMLETSTQSETKQDAIITIVHDNVKYNDPPVYYFDPNGCFYGWFAREFPSDPAEAEVEKEGRGDGDDKRPRDHKEDSDRDGQGPRKKTRTVKEGKKMDIGSMLGSFG